MNPEIVIVTTPRGRAFQLGSAVVHFATELRNSSGMAGLEVATMAAVERLNSLRGELSATGFQREVGRAVEKLRTPYQAAVADALKMHKAVTDREARIDEVPVGDIASQLMRGEIRATYARMKDVDAFRHLMTNGTAIELDAIAEGLRSGILQWQAELVRHLVERRRLVRQMAIGSVPAKPTAENPVPVGIDAAATERLAREAIADLDAAREMAGLAESTVRDFVRFVGGLMQTRVDAAHSALTQAA